MSLKDSLKIMVVDDMSTSRGLLTQSLAKLGVRQVDWRKDGSQALDAIVANPVHLVISDYHMPGMDGVTLLQQLRAHRATARIGFILVTGSTDPALVQEGQKHGLNNFLRKPFTTDGLKQCIERVTGPL